MKEFWLGVLLTVVLHAVWFAFLPGFAVIGVAQLIYVVPLMIYAAVKHKQRLLQGLTVAAGVTFLVNAACFGIVLGSLSN